MEFKKCPNCGMGYDNSTYYCLKCNVRLKPANEVTNVANPELSDVSDRIIGTVSAGGNSPKCPTCGSTNIEKISLTRKAIGGALFGLFSSDVRKTMHCKNCGYKW